LRQHGDQIVKDAVELGIICDNLKAAQAPLQEDIYLGQLQWKLLSEHMATMTDGMSKENVGYLLADLAAATVSLQEVDNLNLQSRYGGALVIRNSNNVRRVIRSTNTLVGTVAAALAVRAAAARQAQVQDVAKMIQDSVHETMVDTSQKVGEAVVKSAEMNQQMMANIEMLKKSCDNFDFAAQRLSEVCSETVKIATLASNAMNDMNEKLRSRADAADSMRPPASDKQE
ncbi:MAG: tellurite resistance protein, partial [Desulfobacteraceae bacterium]